MKSELIVDVQASDVSAALLEDGRLVSLQKEARNIAYAVGDIYLAKVKKLMPGLNAAFVNVGYEKDAFLHYLDLGAHYATYRTFLNSLLDNRRRVPQLSGMTILPDIDKHGTITETLEPGQELLVQIVKEPISSKGPRLTTEISFTGRFLVLTPFCDKVSISQKIKSSAEKARLRQLIESMKPKNFGVIVRTSAEGKKSAELDNELKTLVQSFYETCEKAQRATPPTLVFEEENRVVGMLRDVFSPSFEAIYVNDPDIYSQILKYVSLIAPEKRDIVKLYTKDTPIFDHFGITRQVKSSFGKTVSFKSGAYIIIEHTEALHVIDVNSGNRTKAGSDQETNALEVNLRAADEIARQLRLRDMGGIIVVDFIDMAKSEHRQQLFDHMREIMANDRARHNILPLSKFGLMQITRQRVRPVLDIQVNEECPSCHGHGDVNPSILFTDTLFEKLEYLVNDLQLKGFTMYIHPYVDAYIKKGLFLSMYSRWRRRLGRVFKIIPDESLAYLQFRVFDDKHNELNLIDEKDKGQSSASKTADKEQKRGSSDDTADKSKKAPAAKPEPKQKPEPKAKPDPKQKPEPKPKPEPKQKPAPKADTKQAPTEAAPVKAEAKQAPAEATPVKAEAKQAPAEAAPAKAEAKQAPAEAAPAKAEAKQAPAEAAPAKAEAKQAPAEAAPAKTEAKQAPAAKAKVPAAPKDTTSAPAEAKPEAPAQAETAAIPEAQESPAKPEAQQEAPAKPEPQEAPMKAEAEPKDEATDEELEDSETDDEPESDTTEGQAKRKRPRRRRRRKPASTTTPPTSLPEK